MRHYADATDTTYELGTQWPPGGAQGSAQSVARNGVQGSARGLKSDSEGGSQGVAKSGALTVENGSPQRETRTRSEAH